MQTFFADLLFSSNRSQRILLIYLYFSLCFNVLINYLCFTEALRIHISLEMKKALDAVGGFKIEHRGLVDVKVLQFFI